LKSDRDYPGMTNVIEQDLDLDSAPQPISRTELHQVSAAQFERVLVEVHLESGPCCQVIVMTQILASGIF
jgi:hypothetical protein